MERDPRLENFIITHLLAHNYVNTRSLILTQDESTPTYDQPTRYSNHFQLLILEKSPQKSPFVPQQYK